eukprot:3404529-Prymnesium_polylepis.1
MVDPNPAPPDWTQPRVAGHRLAAPPPPPLLSRCPCSLTAAVPPRCPTTPSRRWHAGGSTDTQAHQPRRAQATRAEAAGVLMACATTPNMATGPHLGS